MSYLNPIHPVRPVPSCQFQSDGSDVMRGEKEGFVDSQDYLLYLCERWVSITKVLHESRHPNSAMRLVVWVLTYYIGARAF